MLEKHRSLLIRHRSAIVEDLLVEDVLTELRSKFIIDQDDSELIKSGLTSRRKAEELLDVLPKKGHEAFQAFYESLLDKYPHLAKLLECGISENHDEPNFSHHSQLNNNLTSQGRMTVVHERLLTQHRVSIVEDLLVDDVITLLQSKFVFDDNDIELIRSEKTSKSQAEKLLDLLVRKGDQAFGHFLSALQNAYPYLAELLQEEGDQSRRSRFPSVAETQEIVETKLLEGGVPKQPQVLIQRPKERHNVRIALHSLKDREAWVVLHGMAGCGKTILAADALRSELLLEIFPGGVVWVQVGSVDRQKLLMKMQNLCIRLDKDKHRPAPHNLEEAKERLQSLFREQHPRTLLVLDDLWSAHDARFFDIRARVLVTTRDLSIADRIEVVRCPVRVPEKLNQQQCKEILAKWTGDDVTKLPTEADHIIAECNEHPLVISIIGALLKGHKDRWSYYLKQLHDHKLSKLKLRIPYQYPDLNEAFAISIENLEENLRSKFYDFVIFDSSVKIPISVFCLLWDEEKVEVEDTMELLENKSLVKSTKFSNEETSYATHNLLSNYLSIKCDDIEARHQKLVESYMKTCGKGDFSKLKDDNYVYWNLVRHMLEAKQQEKAIELLTNLDWVTRKLNVCGPADIINDYIKVREQFPKGERDKCKSLNDFYKFVRTNSHLFSTRPIPDVVQTALSEATNNHVYLQAKEEALRRTKRGGLYVDWCNKQSESAHSLEMTVKPHNGTIHCCVFSSDGKTILSSSSDGTAKLWEAVSGKVLHRFEDHDDAVVCCALSKDKTKVLTTSHDRTVKVWKLIKHQLILTYKDHKQDIHCAAFSPTGVEVISCSTDNTIRIWDCESGQTNAVCKGHSDIVRWCCFSSDGGRIASGSHDQTVKIWETVTGKCLVTTNKHNEFVSYCCFGREDVLVYASSATSIQIWDSFTGESRGSIDIAVQVLDFALSPMGDKIAVALSDATVQLWDIDAKKQLNLYRGHKSWVHTVDFSPDGTQLVSGSADETIKVWPVDTTAFAKLVRLKKVFDVLFKEGPPLIAVADSQNRVKIFEGVQGNELRHSEPCDARITCVVFSLDGGTIAISLECGKIEIIATQSCQFVRTLDGHDGKVYSLTYNRSGSILLSCSQDKTFMTWNHETGNPLLVKQARHEDEVTIASFFDNDKRIVTASKDGTAKVWDSASGNLLFSCDHQRNQWVLTCVVSPDNKRIVTGSVNSVVKAWDAQTGQELFNKSPHSDVIRSLSISEDNLVFASGSDDGTVAISRLVDGEGLSSCVSHTGAWVTDIVFGKNGKQLVTVGNSIQWHAVDGKQLQQFFIKGSHLRRIKCSPDFQLFITVDNVGVLYILEVIK